MSFLDAAEKVLSIQTDEMSMHYKEITDSAIEMGLISSDGKTPEATMSAQLSVDISKNKKRGTLSRFVRHGKGVFGLSKWQPVGIALQIQKHNQRVQDELLRELKSMPPYEFEELVSKLLVAIGFEDVEVTRSHGDGGIDVRGTLVVGGSVKTQMAVQVKRWKNNVQAPVVQQVRGSLGAHERGLIITTGDFSNGAMTEAQSPYKDPIGMMNGKQLVQQLTEFQIGIHRTSYDLIELGDPDSDPVL